MKHIEFDLNSEGLGHLRLNRVDKHNALSSEMLSELVGLLDKLQTRAEKAELKVLLLSSNSEKAFCAGADLNERLKMTEAEVRETLTTLRLVMDGVAKLPCPTLGVAKGIAFGGGLELLLSCDLRILHPDANVGLTELRLAIIPGAGGTQRLTRLVGPSAAKEMIFLAKRLTAENALKIGLANAVDNDPLQLAQEWAREILKAGPLALGAAKKAIDEGLSMELSKGLDWERKCYESVLQSDDRIEGLKAFTEKREPKFRGC